MRNPVLLAVLGFGLVACGGGKSDPAPMMVQDGGIVLDTYAAGMTKTTQKGAFCISLWSQPGPPAMGMNSLTLKVVDGEGNPVSGAWVKVLPAMPQHGHGSNSMPAVAETQPGTYQAAKVELQMMGAWSITVEVNTIDTTDSTVFWFEVQ